MSKSRVLKFRIGATLAIVGAALAMMVVGGCGDSGDPDPDVGNPDDIGDMVFVKGGTFKMGCTAEQGSDCSDAEKPAHDVTLSDFYIGRYEVKQSEWNAVMDNNPSEFKKGGNYPVENVTWEEVQVFISKLNSSTGKNYRLPTEAEWEYAARGGVKSKGYKYSGSNNVDDVAWYQVNLDGTRPVGAKKPNELGIYDMSGNVRELVQDWHEKSYTVEAKVNPTGPDSGTQRVVRNGGWRNPTGAHRVSSRFNPHAPDFRYNDTGFRLAMSP